MKFSTFTLLSISVATALAAPPPPSQKVIHPNGNNAKCLGAASNTDGGAVIIQDCATGSNPIPTSQLWTVAGGTFQIFGNKCLDDTNGVTTNGQKMQIWTCGSGNKNQKWAPTSSGSIGLTSTNKCLDNTDGKTNAGNPAQIWDCTGGKNQKWSIVDAVTPPPAKGNQIKPGKSASQCLTATSNSNNAPVVIQPCDKSASQAWTVTGGTVQIYGNKCLDVPNGSTTNGVKMQIYTCYPGNTNQKYTITSAKQIQWTNKGECLDLTDGNTNPGTPAQMWKCTNNNMNQVWNIV